MPIVVPNYVLIRQLGEGGFAEVWLAEHALNKRKAAVKFLKPAAGMGAVNVEAAFLREAELLAKFDSPNIVQIYDNRRVGEHTFIVMEYLGGGSLEERIRNQGVGVGEALSCVSQIAAALDLAHAQGVIHRDLKPANIMMRDAATPVLMDFGISRVLGRTTIVPDAGLVVGSPLYMSPEQMLGEPLDGRSDIYALGIVLFELLAGQRPHGEEQKELVRLRLQGSVPTLPVAVRAFQPILDRMLARSPEHRFRNGSELNEAIRTILTVAAPPLAANVVPRPSFATQRMEASPSAGLPNDTARPPFWRRAAFLWPLAALALLATGSAGTYLWLRPPASAITPAQGAIATQPSSIVASSSAATESAQGKAHTPTTAPADTKPATPARSDPTPAAAAVKPDETAASSPPKTAATVTPPKPAASTKSANGAYTEQQLEQAYAAMARKDYKRAAPVLKLAGERGVPKAQNYLGILYHHGYEVPQDLAKSFALFLSSARQNHQDAKVNVARCYETGSGVKKDLDKAYEWYIQAAEGGNTFAEYTVARLAWNRGDEVTKVQWLRKAAAKNYMPAEYMLAQSLVDGVGVEKNLAEGRRIMKRAASHGSHLAQRWLDDNPD